MGSSTSSPITSTIDPRSTHSTTSSDEKSHYVSPHQPTAAQLLSKLSLRPSSSLKAKATSDIRFDSIREWEDKVENSAKSRLARTVLSKSDFGVALTDRRVMVRDTQVFNTKVSYENSTVSNQKSSGRCWLFATLNTLRMPMAKKYNLEEFELSQSYLFFYDSLAKANYFLENMLDLADTPLDSREVQYLMVAPENDGGQWDMAVNLISKYGIIPQSLYPESFNSSNTGKLDGLLTSKLREYALELRKSHKVAVGTLEEVQGHLSTKQRNEMAKQSVRARKEEMMEAIYRILAVTLGTPPKPDEKFTWEYYSKDGKFHSITSTPLEFYASYCPIDVSRSISLINDPRNEYEKLYTVQRLGNVWGGRPVLYVNAGVQKLKDVAIGLLKADIPVWFGCDVGKSSSSSLGIMDTDLYDYEGAFDTSLGMTKQERLSTGETCMTHAMTLTAVHLDANGRSVRWRVENSWGVAACDKGFMLMSDDWFSEHVFQIVADRARIPAHLVKIFEAGDAVELPPWDAMGSLA